VQRALTALTVAALCQTGCGIKTEIVASKYVRSQLILAAQGGTLTVTAADSATLAGTQIVIPPGALVADTVITVGPGAGSIAPAGVQTAGPCAHDPNGNLACVVVVGPDDTMFNHPATVRLPFTLPSGAQLDQLVVDAKESDGEGYQIVNSALTIDGGLVSFVVTRFTQFEPDIIHLVANDGGGPVDAGDGGSPMDAGCTDGKTLCPSSDGGAGGDICVDTTSDDQNCGLCGKVCPPGAMCFSQGLAGGTCICDTLAPDAGDLLYCVDFCIHSDSDPLNCGFCGNRCDTGVCVGGDCLCQPDAGIVRCAPHQCSILNAELKNCGACGNDCTLGGTLNLPDLVCIGGQCLCAGGQNDICFEAATFPALSCISTTSDAFNCGGCGLSDAGPLPDGGSPPGPHVCSGVTTDCENGSCVCPIDHPLFCPAGSWRTDAGTGGVTDVCVNDSSDRFNCGACGYDCDIRYAGGSMCQYALCACQATNGVCVSADDPAEPSCDCSGFHDGGSPLTSCNKIKVTYSKDIYPLLSASTVSTQSWGVLVGCAVSGCHDTSAAAGLDFTDPDASYQQLMNTPSQICAGQWLTIPGDGNDSLLTQLLENNFQCPMPTGGTASPMPIDDGGVYHPLSPCLQAQVREWIDQGMTY
jgi:hypothetical protein